MTFPSTGQTRLPVPCGGRQRRRRSRQRGGLSGGLSRRGDGRPSCRVLGIRLRGGRTGGHGRLGSARDDETLPFVQVERRNEIVGGDQRVGVDAVPAGDAVDGLARPRPVHVTVSPRIGGPGRRRHPRRSRRRRWRRLCYRLREPLRHSTPRPLAGFVRDARGHQQQRQRARDSGGPRHRGGGTTIHARIIVERRSTCNRHGFASRHGHRHVLIGAPDRRSAARSGSGRDPRYRDRLRRGARATAAGRRRRRRPARPSRRRRRAAGRAPAARRSRRR